MRAVATRALFLLCLTLSFAAAAAGPTNKTYTWSDIDCSQSRVVVLWPGLKCQATNLVTTEGNIGSFRRWSAFGQTREGYVHLFVWEAENSFSYVSTEDTTAEFLKWMYGNGGSASQFTPVARYHDADYTVFRDGQYTCAGFRRTGHPRRGGYDSIVAGIRCAPLGGTLTNEQFAQFIDQVRLK